VLAVLLLIVPAAWGRTAMVTIKNVEFGSGDHTVYVFPGDSVKWTHRDGDTPHTVSANDGSFDSSPNTAGSCSTPFLDDCMREGETFEHAFPSVGTFSYRCKQHASMTGTVNVVRRGGGGSSPTPPSTGPAVTPTKTSPSVSPTGTAKGTGSPSASPTAAGSVTLSESPRPDEPDGGSGNAKIAVAAAAVLILSGVGFLVYRRFISPS
jgi:plastocyanin